MNFGGGEGGGAQNVRVNLCRWADVGHNVLHLPTPVWDFDFIFVNDSPSAQIRPTAVGR